MLPDLATIQLAHQRIHPFIHRTPVLTCQTLNAISGADLYFKCENFQKVGAFKMRGASNALLNLTEEEKQKGVVTHSSGNHAQALALAAKLNGVKAYIVMPENSPKVKKNAVLGYGAEVIDCANTLESRESTAEQVIGRTGATFIHPYNDYHIIAGQATAAKEILEENGNFDYLLAPVGGGGLLSGTALAAHYLSPETKVIGAEPENANDAWLSFTTGQMQPATGKFTIADGLRTALGELTFELIRKYVSNILTTTEEEILESMQLLMERMKIVIEPSAAVVLAGVLKNKEMFSGKKVALILSGGNIETNLPNWYFKN